MFKVKAQLAKVFIAFLFLVALIIGIFAIDFTIRKWYIKKAVREAITEMRLQEKQNATSL